MEIYERIKILRKEKLSLTQKAFGERLGISRSEVSNIEYNVLANPDKKEPLYRLICSEFNVNYNWLKNGEGEIFTETTESYINKLVADYHLSDMVKSVLEVYVELDEKPRAIIDQFLEIFSQKKRVGEDTDTIIKEFVKSSPELTNAAEFAADTRLLPPPVEHISELSDEEKVDLYRQRLKAAKKTNVSSTTSESA